jgi:hypothetical protein
MRFQHFGQQTEPFQESEQLQRIHPPLFTTTARSPTA